ncbi:hypothetical protein PENTCL1PPCAC_3305, partial [Pristionchus entomophagus]
TSPGRTLIMKRAAFLAATLLVVSVFAQTRDIPVAIGNLGVHYNLRSVISTDAHPLTAAVTGPIWCQVTLNEIPLPIVNSTFAQYGDPLRRKFSPDVNHTSHTASLEVGQTVHDSMGKYRCEIVIMENDKNEKTIFGNLMVYSSPFFHTNGSMNMRIENEYNKNSVIADTVSGTEGAEMVIHCPAVGSPKPNITWYLNDDLLVPSKRVHMYLGTYLNSTHGTKLTIDNFSPSDAGIYKCVATNKYPTRLDVDVKEHAATLRQEAKIGSPYGWIYPLLVILIILLLLFIIIYGCITYKRFRHDNYNVAKREKLLRTPSPVSSVASIKKCELEQSV